MIYIHVPFKVVLIFGISFVLIRVVDELTNLPEKVVCSSFFLTNIGSLIWTWVSLLIIFFLLNLTTLGAELHRGMNFRNGKQRKKLHFLVFYSNQCSSMTLSSWEVSPHFAKLVSNGEIFLEVFRKPISCLVCSSK